MNWGDVQQLATVKLRPVKSERYKAELAAQKLKRIHKTARLEAQWFTSHTQKLESALVQWLPRSESGKRLLVQGIAQHELVRKL